MAATKTTTIKKTVAKKEKVQYTGTGRRKSSVARVRLVPGTGTILVNGIDVNEYVKDTAKIGTLIHGIVESHITGEAIDIPETISDNELEQAEKAFLRFKEWEDKQNIEYLGVEKTLVSEIYKYGGIIDCYCKLNSIYSVVDFKTSKDISYEHFLQTSSYIQLLKENNLPVEQIVIINIPRDENISFKVEVMNLTDSEIYFSIFKSLLDVYYLKKRLGWND